MTKDEALKEALEALKHVEDVYCVTYEEAMIAIEEELAQTDQVPLNWSVFNSGAEVAGGLTFTEAWDYLTPARIARKWCAVCVVDEANQPTEQPEQWTLEDTAHRPGGLAQPEQEPVAWGFQNSAITGSNRWMMLLEDIPANDQYGGALWTPLYTSPPQRQPLTDAEIMQIELGLRQYNSRDTYDLSLNEFARAIEAKHGIGDKT